MPNISHQTPEISSFGTLRFYRKERLTSDVCSGPTVEATYLPSMLLGPSSLNPLDSLPLAGNFLPSAPLPRSSLRNPPYLLPCLGKSAFTQPHPFGPSSSCTSCPWGGVHSLIKTLMKRLLHRDTGDLILKWPKGLNGGGK